MEGKHGCTLSDLISTTVKKAQVNMHFKAQIQKSRNRILASITYHITRDLFFLINFIAFKLITRKKIKGNKWLKISEEKYNRKIF